MKIEVGSKWISKINHSDQVEVTRIINERIVELNSFQHVGTDYLKHEYVQVFKESQKNNNIDVVKINEVYENHVPLEWIEENAFKNVNLEPFKDYVSITREQVPGTEEFLVYSLSFCVIGEARLQELLRIERDYHRYNMGGRRK